MSGPAIPNVFHFVFGLRRQTEPFHLMYYLCLQSCLEVNRPDAVHFHYQHEPFGPLWELIRPRLVLRRIAPRDSVAADFRYEDPLLVRFRYTHLADFERLRILVEEGGIYADIDTLFLRPVPAEWRNRQYILGHERVPGTASQDGSLCNAWIASAPGAEFGRLWLAEMTAAFDGTWSNHSTLLPYRLARRHPELVHVEPATSFYALDWSPEGIDGLFRRPVDLPGEAYSLHLWNHLWFDADRLDFSVFHAGLLTPEYVAHADTTYARHARRFLPAGLAQGAVEYTRQQLAELILHPRRAWRGLRNRMRTS